MGCFLFHFLNLLLKNKKSQFLFLERRRKNKRIRRKMLKYILPILILAAMGKLAFVLKS